MRQRADRRRFLGRLGRGAAGLVVAAGAASPARAYPAAETLRIGCIGCGGRARGALLPNLVRIAGTRLVAFCDVWDVHRRQAETAFGAGGKLFSTRRHEKLLERKDIDAVVVATPDHWHVPITIDACRAGKDVYVEKPLTHDLEEGPRIVEAERQSGRIVQVGMQQRSMPHIREARELLRAGKIGAVHRIHVSWNRGVPLSNHRPRYGIDAAGVDWKRFLGGAPERPFDEYRFRNWRWFWDYGGGILTDLMVHFLDVAVWFCDLGVPLTASSIGDHYQTAGLWETPDTIQTLLHYPDSKIQVFFEGTFFNARHAARVELMGEKGSLYVDRGRYELLEGAGRDARRAAERVVGKGGKGADFYGEVNGAYLHLEDWVKAVRERRRPAAPAAAGVLAAAAAHLGNRAFRSGEVVRREG